MMRPPDATTLLSVLARAAVEELRERVRLLRINRGWKGPFAVFFDHRYTYNVVPLEDHGNRPGRFCHVLVHNASNADIPNCRGVLREIAALTRDMSFFRERDYQRRLQLRWANIGSFRTIEIESGDTARLDLCYTVEGSQVLNLAVQHGPHGIRTRFGPGIYRVTVRAAARRAGTIPTDETFYIIHTGTWDQVRIAEQIPEGIRGILSREEIQNVMNARERFSELGAKDLSTTGEVHVALIVPGFPSPTEIGSRGTGGQLPSTSTDTGPGIKRQDDDGEDEGFFDS